MATRGFSFDDRVRARIRMFPASLLPVRLVVGVLILSAVLTAVGCDGGSPIPGLAQPTVPPNATVPGQMIVQPLAATPVQSGAQATPAHPAPAPKPAGSSGTATSPEPSPPPTAGIASATSAPAVLSPTSQRLTGQPVSPTTPPPAATAPSVSQAGTGSPADGLPVRTPYFRDFWGTIIIDGTPAPIGTKVQAFSPRGELVGLYSVDKQVGSYGYMRVYGEDPTSSPPIPGMRTGEAVVFTVNGLSATTSSPASWQPAFEPVRIELTAKR